MTGPPRLRVELPVSGTLPRVGKIRLGTTVPVVDKDTGEVRKTDWGADIVRPIKADHFVVYAEESGITSQEAVDAFKMVYGDEPRELECWLPAPTPEDIMEGAWRQYGKSKLKIRCNGEMCAKRRETGGWIEEPCQCKSLGLAEDDKRHCDLGYTIQLILPRVSGIGVWQLDTGSTISSRRMADWLTMMANLTGTLTGLEFTLRIVPVKVSPEGTATTVYVLEPQASRITPQQLLAAGPAQRHTAALPPPAADEEHEPTLTRETFADETPSENAQRADGDVAAEPVPDPPHDQPAPPDNPVEHIARQIQEIRQTADGKEELKKLATQLGCQPTIKQLSVALLAQYGQDAHDVGALLDQLEVLNDQI
jgi:hypothetical protein